MFSLCHPFLFPGVVLPDMLSLFNSDKTSSFILFLTRDWDTIEELLSLPNLMGGLRGLRAHIILGPQNTKCFRHCLLAVVEVVSILQASCPEINRGDVSALVSAYSEILHAMMSLCDLFLPSSLNVLLAVKDFVAFGFRLQAVDPLSLLLSPKMSAFLIQEPLSGDMELLFRKRLLSFISGLLLYFQEVSTQWYNGGLALFDLFSVSSTRKFNIHSYEARFDRLTNFLLSQSLVSDPLISSWKSEYPAFARRVAEAATLISPSANTLTFWLDSGCLTDFPSYQIMWYVLCSMGADITESHHFENESFDFGVCVSSAEFQWGVEIVRLFQPSWQDDKNRGVWTLPAKVEEHLCSTESKVAERSLLYGENFNSIRTKMFDRDLAKYQLKAVERLIEQGIDSFNDLSPRKLRAIQLTLGLVEKKLPKTLALVRNRLESHLASLASQIPEKL